ncbi:MAG: Ni-sirohydrochlorin a,c-diamide reductive cyclase catalytic subunit [Methanomassiliicoccales archaeon]|jgi:putative methanogenesis marker 13 metalloprotein
MSDILHPRPNPIIAAMYTLRDLDVDVIIMHGPAGCGFMASRRLEEAGVRVITTGMGENDLIFGAEEKLARILKKVDDEFHPKTIGIVGTCASMIIGENLDGAIKRSGVVARIIPVDTHGCAGPNTNGAIRTLEVASERGIITQEEYLRQKEMLVRATLIEKDRGLTSKAYLEPHPGATKLRVALLIVQALRENKHVAVVLNAKKETAYGFADVMRAVEEARKKVGGTVTYIGNLDPNVGLPRIRRYANDILRDLREAGVEVDHITGGLDEYPISADRASELLATGMYDMRIVAGLPHQLTGLRKEDILVTDQPRELRNYIDNGFELSVGETTTHADVMKTDKVIRNELGDTIREVAERGYG